MWLRELRIKNLKRLRDFTLDLKQPDGSPRKWSVLIGRNGTGKTTILQAAALAAAGGFRANELVQDLRESFSDKRLERVDQGGVNGRVERVVSAEVSIAADFVFGPVGRRSPTSHPFLSRDERALFESAEGFQKRLRARLWINPDRVVEGNSGYVDAGAASLCGDDPTGGRFDDPTLKRGTIRTRDEDLLIAAREFDLPHWFVAGYGVQRDLPRAAAKVERPERTSIDRLRPLFGARELIGPNFTTLFDEPELARSYAVLLKEVLLQTEALVPGITDIELRGRGGVSRGEHLLDSHRFEQSVNGHALKLPARWLSHGYQSSLAWISDLVGQVVLEAGRTVDPRRMEGLVLIDEIDLYLHPSWQVGLIGALRDTFPNLQFIVTTHSPILLSAFRQDEVVMLDYDDEGNVVQVPTPRDPRLLTGSELYDAFFGIDRLYPAELGDKVDAYVLLLRKAARSDAEERTMRELYRELNDQGLATLAPPPSAASVKGARG
ncbi:MAG: AAA family ATPase [Polyangiales bacterium]